MAVQHDDFETSAVDLGPLAWVLDETRKSIQAAAKALKRYVHEAETARGVNLEAVDANPLRLARQQLHQVEGVLDMVGQTIAARVVSGMEGAVQRFIAKPQEVNRKSVAAQETAGFALIEYLESQLSGQPRPALGLFSQYRQIQELAGADRIHPADLWAWSWEWAVPQLPEVVQKQDYSTALRERLDRDILRIMRRDDVNAAVDMGTIGLGLAANENGDRPRLAAFWMLAAGFFEALGGKLIPFDLYAKRATPRVLLQYTTLANGGDGMVSERLANDLLFFCAQAHPSDADTAVMPALAAVRAAWKLESHVPVDYRQPMFGMYDPGILAQARRRVDTVKENWSALAGGDMARLKACTDQFGLVAESLAKLLPGAQPLADELNAVMAQIAHIGQFGPELAMETATAVLFLEASFADFHPADALVGARMQQLATRLKTAREQGASPALEPWMEVLYRQVSDRQTMGTVVGELRVTMGEVEGRLDQFFRDSTDKAPLAQVPDLMHQMGGVLSVLGFDQAVQAVAHMREQVQDLIAAEGEPSSQAGGASETLGNSLGSLGFLVDMLGYQPALARRLFVYDTQRGELKALMERASTPQPAVGATTRIAAAFAPALAASARTDSGSGNPPAAVPATEPFLGLEAAQPETVPPIPAAMAPELQSQFDQLAAHAVLEERPALAVAARNAAMAAGQQDAVGLAVALQAVTELSNVAPKSAPSVQPTAAASAETMQVSAAQSTNEDMLGIFLEEAHEVIAGGQSAIEVLKIEPENADQKTVLRRAFHTLKGSSRMVGLAEFGESAWALEQVLNTWLAERKPVGEDLRGLACEALDALGRWIDDIAVKHVDHWSSAPFRQAADALRLRGKRVALDLSVQGIADGAAGAVKPWAIASAPEPQVESRADFALTEPATITADAAWPDTNIMQPEALLDAGGPKGTESTPLLNLALLPDLDLTVPAEPESTLAARAEQPAASNTDNLLDLDSNAGKDKVQVEFAQAAPVSGATFASEAELAATELETRNTIAVSDTYALAEIAPLSVALVPEPIVKATAALITGPTEPPAQPAQSAETVPAQAAEQTPPRTAPKKHKQIGDLHISNELYEVYLEEAEGWSRGLTSDLTQWALALEKVVPEHAIAMAHSLAGSSATVGLTALSSLARAVEHALARLRVQDGGRSEQLSTLGDAVAEIRRVLHQFAAGLLYEPKQAALEAINAIEAVTRAIPASVPATSQAVVPVAVTVTNAPRHAVADNLDATDAIDPDLFPIFEQETEELLPQLEGNLREWVTNPGNDEACKQVKRLLHTLKGGARLAGALRLGEMAHRAESAIELIDTRKGTSANLGPIQDYMDEIAAAFHTLQAASSQEHQASDAASLPATAAAPLVSAPAPVLPIQSSPPGQPGEIAPPAPLSLQQAHGAASQLVRVKTQLLDRLVNQAGEVMTSRSRLETGVGQLRSALTDLSGNLERLRTQLRDVELQAETQMQSRMAQTKDVQQSFDPLEFDRFTRMQELTRMMAESVNDVATVQRVLQRAVQSSEDELVVQARQTRELQHDLLRTRMVEFESISERLYRVVRQASKEEGKQVRLDIVGGALEVDRGILERMTGSFEHLLRNSVVHGIEAAPLRAERHKSATGTITIQVRQTGNDMSIEFRDDGNGLDLQRIREKAESQGLVKPGQTLSENELTNLVFVSGLSTASQISDLAGRGVGMDVVRTEVQALGGRIKTHSQIGQGTCFEMVLPLTTAVTQVVMLRAGKVVIGVPSNLVEIVRRTGAADLKQAYNSGAFVYGENALPFFWAGALLQSSPRSEESPARATPVVVFHSVAQRLAMHVDEVLDNREVVVKALGPQLSHLPGLVAVTTLASGEVMLIYNPVALATVYGDQASMLAASASRSTQEDGAVAASGAASQPDSPLVLVVDDSITVRRVTQRLLQREGYRVALANDGLQGLEQLGKERPAVVLCDIEMPRMDGFDFVRNIRADEQLRDLPVIMITSRIAEKHRAHAHELGVDHYLGKPYSEKELLKLICEYIQTTAAQAATTRI